VANFLKDIEEHLAGESVEAVVVDPLDRWSSHRQARDAGITFGVPVPWEQAKGWFDYEYDDGYGGSDCHPVYIWTATRVLFVVEYDGATSMASVPRCPTVCEPEMNGCSDPPGS
jgi:hypothetical protein